MPLRPVVVLPETQNVWQCKCRCKCATDLALLEADLFRGVRVGIFLLRSSILSQFWLWLRLLVLSARACHGSLTSDAACSTPTAI